MAQRQKRLTVFDKILDQPFDPYMGKDAVQQGLKRGELIQGVLRINPKNYEEAFIDDPAHGPDFFVSGFLARNRAFQEDVVVIQILPEDHWIKCDSVEMEENVSAPTVPTIAKLSLEDDLSVTNTVTMSSAETLIDRLYSAIPVERKQSSVVSKNEKLNPVPRHVRRTAMVVYIIEKVHSRTCAGYLKSYDRSKNLALFSPRDSKVPRVLVSLSDCPKDFCQKVKSYESNLFICYIQDWPSESPFPSGKLMRSLGEAGEIERESEAFLIENDVDYSEFTHEVLECLPKQTPWTIPQEEVAKRRDFRTECVFTIDPETAKDLDDALHIKILDNDVYEVGVHIADVSYFIQPGTPLDQVASKRATSVYLVHKVIPMLPGVLCEQLCSLNPNEDRLTFSVVWKVSKKGEFLSEWIGKSVICSCAKLSYGHAQHMIDGELDKEYFPSISGGYSIKDVAEAVDALNKLAILMRGQRRLKGTLRLDQPKLSFTIDQTTGLPNGCHIYSRKESNKLIEEFMLMANMTVARQIYKAFPDVALLRRHPRTKEKSADILKSKFSTYGIGLDTTSAATIQHSLDNYVGQSLNKAATVLEKTILTSQCAKIMELAKYFSAGSFEVENYHHYALNVPFYTHFTSPIRRYADMVVHRQLASALEKSPVFMTTEEVQGQSKHCNSKKKAAKTVGDLSTELFLSVVIKECGPLQSKGMVIGVLDKSFDVFIGDFGVTKRIYCEKIESLKKFSFDKHGSNGVPQLTLEWLRLSTAQADSKSTEQILSVFTMLDVTLVAGSKSPLQFEVIVQVN